MLERTCSTKGVIADCDNDWVSDDEYDEHKEEIILFCENSNKMSNCLQHMLYAKEVVN
jgi:hypothetical protein